MKKLLIICGLLFSVITFAQAQQGQGGRRGGTPEERAKRTTEMLTKKLSLTADQQTKVSAIYLEQAAAMKKLREDASGDRDAMRAAMKKSTEESDAKVTALLNDDQKKAYAAWKDERKEAMKKRGQGNANDSKESN